MMTFVIAIIFTAWLAFAVVQGILAFKEKGWQRILGLVAATFMAVGASAFFGPALLALGVFGLPTSFEWPLGLVKGVISTKDGFFVVPHPPTGRIQVYDSDWSFVRGWHVNAGAGTFKLFVTDTNRIHVVTARRQMHFEFDLNGKVLSETSYEDTATNYSTFVEAGEPYIVPTRWYLWVFASPAFAWIAAAVGGAMLAVKDKLSKRSKRKRKRDVLKIKRRRSNSAPA